MKDQPPLPVVLPVIPILLLCLRLPFAPQGTQTLFRGAYHIDGLMIVGLVLHFLDDLDDVRGFAF